MWRDENAVTLSKQAKLSAELEVSCASMSDRRPRLAA